MANKRMFSSAVIETDVFLDLPPKCQALYIHLAMHADDDGFVSPRTVMRSTGCSARELNILESSGFMISFQSGVAVIVDWKENNTIKADRYKPTRYQKELAQLDFDSTTKRYSVKSSHISGTNLEPGWNQIGTKLDTQYSIDKNRVVEVSLVESRTGKSSQQRPTAPPCRLCAPQGRWRRHGGAR